MEEEDTFTTNNEQNEEEDDMNDETFGGDLDSSQMNEELPAFFTSKNNDDKLPEFFRGGGGGGGGGGLEDEPLEEEKTEDEDQNNSLSENNHNSFFPTQSSFSDTERNFFWTENEANLKLDSQMESMFNMVLKDDDDLLTSAFRLPNPQPIPQQPQQQIPLQRQQHPQAGFQFPQQPQQQQPQQAQYNLPPQFAQQQQQFNAPQQPQQDDNNVLNKLFRSAQQQPQQAHQQQQQQFAPKMGMSVEEIEARMRANNRPMSVEEIEARMRANQQPQQQQQSQQHPMGLPPALAQLMMAAQMQQQNQQQQNQQQQQQQQQQSFPGRMVDPRMDPRMMDPRMMNQMNQANQMNQMNQIPPNQMNPQLMSIMKQQQQQQQQQGSKPLMPAHLSMQSNAQSPSRDSRAPNRDGNAKKKARWTQNSDRMSASEIETILRMQESQLHMGLNQYADDFYCQSLHAKRQRQSIQGQQAAVASSPAVAINLHKPLLETLSLKHQLKPKSDLGSVLGKVSSASAKAPKELLQLDESVEHLVSNLSSSKAYSSLMTIENALCLVVEIEDADSLLRHPASVNFINIAQLKQAREQLTLTLFNSLQVYILPQGRLPPLNSELKPCLPEDGLFGSMLSSTKGVNLAVRCLPLLFHHHVLAIFFGYMRNLALILSFKSMQQDNPLVNRFFQYLSNIIAAIPAPQTVVALQTILLSHSPTLFFSLLQTKWGMSIIQWLLKRGHDLNLSPFSREAIQSQPDQDPQSAQAGFHWKETITQLMNYMQGKFNALFQSQIPQNKLWEFLAVLAVNINGNSKRSMLAELSEIVKKMPMTGTLEAFLQLVGSQ